MTYIVLLAMMRQVAVAPREDLIVMVRLLMGVDVVLYNYSINTSVDDAREMISGVIV